MDLKCTSNIGHWLQESFRLLFYIPPYYRVSMAINYIFPVALGTGFKHTVFPCECSSQAPAPEEAFEKQVGKKTSVDASQLPPCSE